jgi:hypothetical protein
MSPLIASLLVFLAQFWAVVSVGLYGLLGLIILQVVLGVSLAIKTRVFEWKKLGDFYTTYIIPFVLSWLAFAFVSGMGIASIIDAPANMYVSLTLVGMVYAAIVIKLITKIRETAVALYGDDLTLPTEGSKGP